MRVVDLSALGLGWESDRDLPVGAEAVLRFPVDGRYVTLPLRVQNHRAFGTRFRYGGGLVGLSENDRRALVLFLYQHHAPTLFSEPFYHRDPLEAAELKVAS